ncbi:aarF domain-containing protein kinase 1 isoform X1 [Rissa tridactyla]|uniref:aarF domain-containing protein kinase 1 isoform X1 n=2 Tax=Rissa tridactyla TaxID=75485 RepID=UPI0023BB07C9|nr:aarF domain-containing protein kinase 1 isoform X1 [Rissa tridactyla]XP_054055544.1 aarF domain-containing protein kinase 1 isoform X1 [Rissa tridactyla]
MARRALKLASLAAATSGIYLYGNKFLDPNDFGVVRVGRAIATTAVITYDYLTSLRSVPYGSEEYDFLKSQVHLRSAERLRELCCANRGTFIKVGQHLGALDYLLPEEYTRTLKVLHSQAPQSTRQEIEQVIREDLGKELLKLSQRCVETAEAEQSQMLLIEESQEILMNSLPGPQIKELFVSFEDTPLGAASLAQVHKAVLQDGRTVAVKIQHPKVQAQSSKDILLMEVLLLVVKQIFPDFEFMWLVEEAKKNLPLELDFLNEGRNAEKVAHMLKNFDFLKVPRIYWELSTRRVLLMEFMEGGQVNDRAYMERNGINVNEISRNLGKLYSEMIFVNGFVHCDPHPGNVLVKKCPASGKAHIILLDHGLYQVLSESFRMDYCRLWQALIKADMKRVQKYSRRLGAGDLYPLFACMLTARSWESVNRGIDRSPVSASEDVEIRSNAAAYLPQITQLLNNVPRQMLLLLKTNDLLRGIESALHTRASASSFLNMSRCCIRAVSTYQRSKSHSLYRKAQISLAEALSLWQINLYELFLWLKGSRMGNWVIALLSRMHHSTY